MFFCGFLASHGIIKRILFFCEIPLSALFFSPFQDPPRMKKKAMSETTSASTSAHNQGTIKPSAANLPMQEISGEVLVEKYAKGDEQTVAEVRRRVARALAAIESEDKRAHWEAKFLEAQEKGFVPAGRINSAAGTTLAATLAGPRALASPSAAFTRAMSCSGASSAWACAQALAEGKTGGSLR